MQWRMGNEGGITYLWSAGSDRTSPAGRGIFLGASRKCFSISVLRNRPVQNNVDTVK